MPDAISTATPAESSSAPSNQPSRHIVRTRNGCLVCRKRRIKCDLGRPECARCIKYAAECVYPKKQVTHPPRSIRPVPSQVPEALQTSHSVELSSGSLLEVDDAFAAEPIEPSLIPTMPAVHSSSTAMTPFNPSAIHPASVSEQPTGVLSLGGMTATGWHASLEALGPVERLLAICRNTRMGSFFLQPSAPPDFLQSFFVSTDDLQCFHHCVTYSLSIIVISEDRNPWLDHVAPLFMSKETGICGSEALKSSMLYLGAVHLAYLRGRDGDTLASAATRTLALQYRATTIRIMRILSRETRHVHNPTFLSAGALTLTADLLSANIKWRELLRLVRRAVTASGGFDEILSSSYAVDPALKCSIEALVNLSILAALSTKEKHSLLLEKLDNPEALPLWWTRLEEAERSQPTLKPFEATCGMLRSLVSRFSVLLSILPHSLCCGHDTDAALIDRVESRWYEWMITDGFKPMDTRTHAGSLAIWHAGRILLLRLFRGVSRADGQVQEAAAEILAICASVGDKVEYLNWPLVIACSALTDSVSRDTARNQLKSFVTQCCYEIEVVQMICEEMWKRMDDGEDDEACGWVEIMLESGCPVLLG